MDTPGNILKSERTKQNKSLSGIARSLKISVEYLEAIEEDKYHLLPAEVYTRAYLRLYAESLGIESNYVLSLYKVEPKSEAIEKSKPAHEKISLNYKLIILAVSTLALVTGIIVLSSRTDQKPAMDIAGKSQETEVVSAVKEVKAVIEVKPVRDVKVAKEIKAVKDLKLSLKIAALELTWISVSIDGDKRKEWSMRAGEVMTITASDKFLIKIGNAGGTRLFLNNEDLGTLGPPGKIVDIVLP